LVLEIGVKEVFFGSILAESRPKEALGPRLLEAKPLLESNSFDLLSSKKRNMGEKQFFGSPYSDWMEAASGKR